jgi:hypothetical protein
VRFHSLPPSGDLMIAFMWFREIFWIVKLQSSYYNRARLPHLLNGSTTNKLSKPSFILIHSNSPCVLLVLMRNKRLCFFSFAEGIGHDWLEVPTPPAISADKFQGYWWGYDIASANSMIFGSCQTWYLVVPNLGTRNCTNRWSV